MVMSTPAASVPRKVPSRVSSGLAFLTSFSSFLIAERS